MLFRSGVRPTFKYEGEKVVETHVILPASQPFDIYGEELEVQFVEKFREEKKFSSFEDLKRQIFADRAQASQFFRIVD